VAGGGGGGVGVGVEVNGKHHKAEKTGCVLVYSDERTEKY